MSRRKGQKSDRIDLRLIGDSGEQIYLRLEELCRETGLNRSALIRAMILGTELKRMESPDLWELKRNADRIRNDLNQLTRLAVRDGTLPREEIAAAAKELAGIRELLERLG